MRAAAQNSKEEVTMKRGSARTGAMLVATLALTVLVGAGCAMGTLEDPHNYGPVGPIGMTGPQGSQGPQGLAGQPGKAAAGGRAGAVKAALVGAGVPADKIQTGAFGETRRKCAEATEACWQRDRRVEVLV